MTQAETIVRITDDAQAVDAARTTAIAEHQHPAFDVFIFADGSRIALSEGERWHTNPDAVSWYRGRALHGVWQKVCG